MSKYELDYRKRVNLINGDSLKFLTSIENKKIFDLVVTSPPYNIGKSYEKKQDFSLYLDWQKKIIDSIIPKLKDTGSICWQVGNYIDKDSIYPIDIALHEIFRSHGLKLKNRIIWSFGHGLHNQKKFSGRYEVIMWYTKTNDYIFNLDNVRIPSKYPNKRFYKGPNKGKVSSNPLGKNPSDVWEIPNVKSNHIEKTEHPCQFPIALVERLVLALTNKNNTVFDPFMGVASAGIAAMKNNRKFIGVELDKNFFKIGKKRAQDFNEGKLRLRPLDKPIYEPKRDKNG